MLKTYDDEHAVIFPTSWKVDEVLANSFCEGTRDDFKGMLSRSMRRINVQGLDVDLLLSCLQQTLDFEQYLEHRFTADVGYPAGGFVAISKPLSKGCHSDLM